MKFIYKKISTVDEFEILKYIGQHSWLGWAMAFRPEPSESLKARKVFIFQHFSFNEQLKLHAQLS